LFLEVCYYFKLNLTTKNRNFKRWLKTHFIDDFKIVVEN